MGERGGRFSGIRSFSDDLRKHVRHSCMGADVWASACVSLRRPDALPPFAYLHCTLSVLEAH